MPRQLDLLDQPDGRTSVILTSGFVVDLLKPDFTDCPYEDLIWMMSAQARWLGATKPHRIYVPQHCVRVSQRVPKALAWDALNHDLEEFTGDIVTPLKNLLGRDHVRLRLRPIKLALAHEFGFRIDLATIKRIDLEEQATEIRDLAPPHWMRRDHLPPPHPEKIVPVSSEESYEMFLEHARELGWPARRPSAKQKRLSQR